MWFSRNDLIDKLYDKKDKAEANVEIRMSDIPKIHNQAEDYSINLFTKFKTFPADRLDFFKNEFVVSLIQFRWPSID